MQLNDLLTCLGYADSPNFLVGDGLLDAAEHAHIFRKSHERCGLRGTYTLQQREQGTVRPLVPAVYVCEAEGDEQADLFHRLVWNQNVVPFVLVLTPSKIRLYSGFKYARSQRGQSSAARGVLRAAINFNEVMAVLAAFKAESIDDAEISPNLVDSVMLRRRVF